MFTRNFGGIGALGAVLAAATALEANGRVRLELDTSQVEAVLAIQARPAAGAAPPVKTARVNGLDLAYVDEGRGDAVVLVHGAGQDYRAWSETWPGLAGRYRVIAYSRRYHHPNPPAGATADYSLGAHAADLVALLDHLKIGKAHLVGHSAGANVAVLVARRYPGRVRSIVLGEPFLPAILLRNPEGQSLLPDFKPGQEAFARGDVEGAARHLAEAVLGPGGWERVPARERGILLDNLPAQMRAEAATPPDKAADVMAFTCEEARQVTTPTLLLKGEQTRPVFAVLLDELATCMPRADRAVLPGASHALQLEKPDAFREIVQPFLAQPARAR